MADKKTHWKQLQDSPYLGAYSLQPGQEIVLTIARAGKEAVMGADGKKEDCMVIHFAEKGVKPMVVNATNAKAITKVAGTPYIEDWTGCRIQIYAEKVRAFGDVVDALRVRSHKPKAAAPAPKCEECGNEVKAAFNKTAQALAQYTTERYGRTLCADCAAKAAGEGAAE